MIAAATASLTLLAGAAAISLNTGILGASPDDGVGHVSPVGTTAPGTVYLDGPAPTRRPSASAPDRSDDHGAAGDHEYEGADDDD